MEKDYGMQNGTSEDGRTFANGDKTRFPEADIESWTSGPCFARKWANTGKI